MSIAWKGRYVQVHVEGQWEYVSRTRSKGAAVIVALDDDDHVLLVEQHRVPLGRACLELPAGLIGDETADEDALTAASRELEEETGWRAATLELMGEFAVSPGMASETFTLFRARGLTRVSAGGGVEGEGITVHRVPRSAVPEFVAAKRAAGLAIDVKLLLLMGFLDR